MRFVSKHVLVMFCGGGLLAIVFNNVVVFLMFFSLLFGVCYVVAIVDLFVFAGFAYWFCV